MNRTAGWLLVFATISLSTGACCQSYLNLPLAFEANRGQTDASARFLAHGPGYGLYLTPGEVVLRLTGEARPLRLKLLGATAGAAIEGLDPLPGRSNYLRGNDPSRWITGVPQYRQVRYRGVYPGIDLIYYGNRGHLEYDFVVAPGADPNRIMLAFDGPESGKISTKSGDLLLTIGHSKIRNLRPRVYQMVGDDRREVTGRYRLAGSRFGFALGAYDHSRELVIDPTILYATSLGTSGSSDGLAVALDSAGNAYLAGSTTDTAFPTQSAVQSALVAAKDVFITKIDASGTVVLYSTYLGGSGSEEGQGIAVDASGNAYIAGYTQSSDFPTHAALQASLAGRTNAFVAKLNSAGSGLLYSTYLGGTFIDVASAIAIDSGGNAYVAGYSLSSDFPTVAALQPANKGTSNAFVAKLNAAGSALVYSTYLGGTGADAAYGAAVDSFGNVYVTGSTSSSDFPTVNPIQPANGGGNDIFIAKLNSAGSGLVYATYYGGSGQDDAYSIALDVNNNVYVGGFTSSWGMFPLFNSMPPPNNTQAGVLVKLNAAGSAVFYATTLDTNGKGVAVDSFGNAYVTGRGFDISGNAVTLALRVNATASALDYVFTLGSAVTNVAEAIAVDASGNAYVSGQGKIDTTLKPPASNSTSNTFVSLVKIGDAPGAPHIGVISPATTVVGSSGVTVQIFGAGFISGATVQVGGLSRAASLVNSTEVDVALLSADLTAAATITLGVMNPGGSLSNTVSFTIVNPPPVITSISPNSANAGDPAFLLTVNGSGFLSGTQVFWNGSARNTTVVNSAKVTAQISVADLSTGGIVQVRVNAPAPGGGLSAAAPFSISNPAPSITLLTPSSRDAGSGDFQLTVQGTNFTPTSFVAWNGSPRATNFASKNQLQAIITAADMMAAGNATVTVVTPAPGGGSANASFNVTGNSVPAISGLSPSAVIAGSAGFTLTVNGSGFVPLSQVQWSAAPRSTAFVNPTQLTIQVPAGDIAAIGSAAITVVSPGPGGGTSNSVSLAINGNPAPTVSSISPTSAIAGSGAFTLTVNGTGFVAGSSVYWGGTPRSSSVVSPTQITAQISTGDIADGGTVGVQVFTAPPGGGLSSPAQMFSISNPVPSITTITPNTLPIGGSNFTLAVNGSGFTPSSKVLWNGTQRPTTFTSNTAISAAIPASDISVAGTDTVSVFNQAPGGGTSNTVGFTVASNPTPSITMISPSVLGAGSAAFTLRVTGSGFISDSKVQWNASDRPTAFVSPTQLTAAISSSDVAGVGTATVTVVNLPPGGGTSNPATFTISSGCLYSLTPSATNFSAAAATGTVDVNTPPGCAWTAATSDAFLAITGGAAGSGSGTVSFSVDANSGAGRNGTLTIAAQSVAISQAAAVVTYLVGDVFPSSGMNAGQFGDGSLDTLDLLSALRAITGVPGTVPPACSDLFDALDAYPPDASGVRGGDGMLNTLDLLTILRRATGVDADRPARTARNLCSGVQTQERRRAGRREGVIEIASGEVFLTASYDLDLAGLALSMGIRGTFARAGVTWSPSVELPPTVFDDALPGIVAIAWLHPIRLRAGDRLRLGHVSSDAPLTVSPLTVSPLTVSPLTIFGISADARTDGRAITIGTSIH